MDRIDREIVELLRGNARISYKDIGEQVCLSANAVSERMRQLQSSGVIRGYDVKVDMRALDLPMAAIIDVKMSPGMTADEFEAGLHTIPGIVEAMLMTGSFDYMLRVACRDQDALVRLTETLRARGGVQETYTRMLLRTVNLKSRLTA
jgi:Lrp/AsnC family leucine-responsive transcriptional regulator